MDIVPTTEALAAAALIMAALAASPRPLLKSECERIGTGAGATRKASREGLEWAIRKRLVRRSYGPHNSFRHQLASSPQLAGELASTPRNGVHVA